MDLHDNEWRKILFTILKKDVKKRPIFAHKDVSKRNSVFFIDFDFLNTIILIKSWGLIGGNINKRSSL